MYIFSFPRVPPDVVLLLSLVVTCCAHAAVLFHGCCLRHPRLMYFLLFPPSFLIVFLCICLD